MRAKPQPVNNIPIWIGGHANVALRRACKVGDGWHGAFLPIDETEDLIKKLKFIFYPLSFISQINNYLIYLKVSKNFKRYPDSDGAHLKSALANEFKLNKNRIILGSGSDQIFELVCKSFLKKGDDVIVPKYSFIIYRIYSKMNGAKVIYSKENNFTVSVKDILKKVFKFKDFDSKNTSQCDFQPFHKGKIKIKKESIMGGMSCNEMSLVPWQILKKTSNYCVSVTDNNVAKTTAMLKDRKLSRFSIIGGECATPGVIALIGLANNFKARKSLNLNEDSNILVIGCEGNADVKLYKQLLSKGRK